MKDEWSFIGIRVIAKLAGAIAIQEVSNILKMFMLDDLIYPILFSLSIILY